MRSFRVSYSVADEAEQYLYQLVLKAELARLMKLAGVSDGLSFLSKYGKRLMDLTPLEAIQLIEGRM